MIMYDEESGLLATNGSGAVNINNIDVIRYEGDNVRFMGHEFDLLQRCADDFDMLLECFDGTEYQAVMNVFVDGKNVVAYTVDSPTTIIITMVNGERYKATQVANENPLEVISDLICGW